MATSPDRPSPRPAEPAEDGRADPIWVGDTIAAIATAAGKAGIGIVRLSGPDVPTIARSLLGRPPRPRHAHYLRIHDGMGHVLDDGLLLLFPGPASYTGEDTLELQTHGNPHLLNAVLRRCLELGARPARPGEFTERAFLNGKLDLAQAEAVADLIAAGSDAAARAARRSLDGLFSERIADLADRLTDLRVYVEAAIDFPEEEIDVLAGPELGSRLADVRNRLHRLLAEAERGVRLRDGLHVVIIGEPNAGKSSLLNRLAGGDRAIVTDIPGTTRDTVRETVRIDGIELTLVDTAGLRTTDDVIESEGIRRARAEMARADLLLAVTDAREGQAGRQRLAIDLPSHVEVLWIANKSDLLPPDSGSTEPEPESASGPLPLSTRTGQGLDRLRDALRRAAGLDGNPEGAFTARNRHLDALRRVEAHLSLAEQRLAEGAGELAAEDLHSAHDALGEITGRTSPDALLGEIFGRFCIGK